MTGAYITANTLKKSFILRNQIIIEELEDVKNEFCKPHLNGNSQKTFSVNKLEKIVNSKIKRLNQQIKSLKGDK